MIDTGTELTKDEWRAEAKRSGWTNAEFEEWWAEGETGNAGPVSSNARRARVAEYDPSQPRDDQGQWSKDGGGSITPRAPTAEEQAGLERMERAEENRDKIHNAISVAPDTARMQKPEAQARAKEAAFERIAADPEFAARAREATDQYRKRGFGEDSFPNPVDDTAVANFVGRAVPDPQDWVHSAADNSVDSLATQHAAGREFGNGDDYIEERIAVLTSGDDPGRWNRTWVAASSEPAMELRQASLRAEYEHTQGWLREQGIGPKDPVTLYRGDGRDYPQPREVVDGKEQWPRPSARGDEVDADLNPLSSWSTDRGTAEGFMGGGGTTVQTTVPAERIFSTAATGWGSWTEREVIIIAAPEGEQDTATVVEHYGYTGSVSAASKKRRRIRLDDEGNEDWIKRVADQKRVALGSAPETPEAE